MSRATAVVAAGVLGLACSRTVYQVVVPVSLDLAPADTTIVQGRSVPLVVTARDTEGRVLPNVPVAWASSDTTIVTVSAAGLVTSRGPVGDAVIRATLATLFDEARVRVLDSNVVRRLVLGGGPHGVAVSPTGVAYVTRLFAGSVQRLDLATRSLGSAVAVGAVPTRVTIGAAGTKAYVSNQSAQSVSIIDDTLLYVATRDGGTVMEVNGRTMTYGRTFSLPGRAQGLALSPDAAELYVANETANRVHVIDLAAGRAVASVPLEDGAFGLALGGDGTRLYASLLWAGKVAVIDRLTRRVVATVVTGGSPRGVAVDAGTQLVIVTNEAGWVDLLR